jgi:hypothetical protein
MLQFNEPDFPFRTLRNSSTVAQRLMDNRYSTPFGCCRILKQRGSALLWSLFENKSSLTNDAVRPHRIARLVSSNLLSAYEQAKYQVAFCHRHREPRALLVDFHKVNLTLANSVLDPRTLHAPVPQMCRHFGVPDHIKQHIGLTLRQAQHALGTASSGATPSFPLKI